MKKSLVFCLNLVLALNMAKFAFAASKPYIEAQTGFLASGFAPVYGFRGGTEIRDIDVSFGYWAARGLDSDDLASKHLDLHTLSLEAYHIWHLGALTGKLGGGVGFTIPNLDGGTTETADYGHSWVFGGGMSYPLSDTFELAADIKGFFFTTERHLDTYGSHTETATIKSYHPTTITTTKVEVLDVTHRDDQVNFNSLLFTVGLKWR